MQLARAIVSRFVYNPKQGIAPSGLYSQLTPQMNALRALAINPNAQNKQEFIQAATQNPMMFGGMVGPVQAKGNMINTNALAEQSNKYGTNMYTPPPSNYQGESVQGKFELPIYDKAGNIIENRSYNSSADVKNAMQRLALEPGQMAGPPRNVTPDSIASLAGGRPAHQAALEQAANSKNWVKVGQILDSIPLDDPYKQSMESLFRKFVPK